MHDLPHHLMSHMMLETDNRQDIQTPSVVSMPKLNVGAPPPPHHYRPNPTGESDHITFNSNGKERETSHSYTITCSVKMIKGPIITPPSGGKKKRFSHALMKTTQLSYETGLENSIWKQIICREASTSLFCLFVFPPRRAIPWFLGFRPHANQALPLCYFQLW